ncbi:TetR family transcriptional regulator [Gordonia sp. TBRC 11910]|uniref:TetR family transcriptional regulator n=1 Tax=Gordonia asplenii TaxID=2725283 RepID=A0A848KNH1_9ACTN|nr:TetR/AcrR family transcriptional regulator C-terminal domain-containing protein [Gordonia asplenii]NMN99771.1 TetR family transcriptional regulator [Gordonia asplenii]
MPGKLTRQIIVDAAFEVLDDVGIDGLTVRALATRLGVKAPALYWHVKSKQDLLDEMGTEVARRIARRSVDADDFADALRVYAETMRTEYLRHRDGARTFSGTALTDPEMLRGQEDGLRRWRDRGISVERVVDAFEIVTAFVVGFVIEEQERTDESRYSLQRRDAAVGPEYPLVVDAGHHIFRPAQERFDAQLGVVVDAVAQGTRSDMGQ